MSEVNVVPMAAPQPPPQVAQPGQSQPVQQAVQQPQPGLITLSTGKTVNSVTGVEIEKQLEAFMKAAEPVLATLEQQGTVLQELRRVEKIALRQLKESGNMELLAEAMGKEYKPTFGDRVDEMVIKSKNALVTVMYAAAPFGLAWVVYQGIRFLVPEVRHWPSLGISYDEEEMTTGRRR